MPLTEQAAEVAGDQPALLARQRIGAEEGEEEGEEEFGEGRHGLTIARGVSWPSLPERHLPPLLLPFKPTALRHRKRFAK